MSTSVIRLTVPEIGSSEVEAVREVLASGFLVQGEKVRAFEEALSRYLGGGEVVAVGSGTAALHLALLALGVGDGDEVLVPDFTFPATANAVIHCGATPVLVDIERDTLNMDPEAARENASPQTVALVPVHSFGRPADLVSLGRIAEESGLAIIEDAACALGSRCGPRPCGTVGAAGCFSFHPRKSLTTGEGGAVYSRGGALLDRVRSLRSHGAEAGEPRMRFASAGFNYRMTEMGAALGIRQLERLDEILSRKEHLVDQYRAALDGLPGVSVLPPLRSGQDSHQSFVVLLGEAIDRDQVVARMRELGVETTIGTYALHREPLFQSQYGYRTGQLPVSDWAFRQTLTLPLYPGMGEGDVARVCEALEAAIRTQTGGGR